MHVCIIGAGIIGLSTAVTLADEGHTVTIVDPAPASGATHHAGGMLAPAAEVIYQQDPLFPLMQAAGRWYPGLIDVVAAHTDVPTGYRTEGTLVVAADRADATHLSELLDYQRAHHMRVESITPRAARQLEPALTPRLAGAVSIPGDHQVSPRMFAAALLDAAANMGVKLLPDRATAIELASHPAGKPAGKPGGKPADTPARVMLASGEVIAADQVIVANGLGANDVGGWKDVVGEGGIGRQKSALLALRPVYGDILRLAVPAHLRPLVTKVVRGFVEDRPVYIIPRPDDTIAIGATSREDDRAIPRAGAVFDLLRDAIRIMPGIEECDFLEATTGARPGTPDDLPYLGRLHPQLVISTGYFRHGILLSALAATVTADIVAGREPSIDISACDPLRFAGASPTH